MTEVTVAIAQMHPKLGAVEENLATMVQWIERIGSEQDTDLIIFPELATTGYECGQHFVDLAQRIPGAATNYIGERAAHYNTHVLFGMAETGKPEGVIYDSSVLIGPDGELIHVYRKVHLKAEERLIFRPGFKYAAAETGFGMLGMLIGWDVAFPEGARSLALQEADLICVCASWEEPHQQAWQIYNQARALENSAFVASANRVGEEYSYDFLGDSMIVGPRGDILACIEAETAAPEPEEKSEQGEERQKVEGYTVLTLDLNEVSRYREDLQLLQARQPRSYRQLSRMY
jgi:predicted amidohydrolase